MIQINHEGVGEDDRDEAFNQHHLPIDLHHYAKGRELLASKYLETGWRWWEKVMPMCQSPKIADALLRTQTSPANDNCAPVRTGMKLLEPEGILRPVHQTFRHRVRVHFSQLISLAMSATHATQHKKQEISGA